MDRFEDLPQIEQINIIIGQFSGHERMDEIAAILSILTSYKIKGEDYVKYYDELVTEEIKERINDAILSIGVDGDAWQREQNAWVSILNSLGYQTIFEIMDNWKKYVSKFITIENQLEDIKKRLYEDYLKED